MCKNINKSTCLMGERKEAASALIIFAVMVGMPIMILSALAWLIT